MGHGKVVALAVAAIVLMLVPASTVAVAETGPGWVEIVVTHEEPLTGDDARGSSLDRFGVHVERVRRSDEAASLRHWRQQPDVVEARRALAYHAAVEPTDPTWPVQYESQQVEVDRAWDTTLGSPSVVIAVLDTGLDPLAPDFAGRVAPGGHDYVNDDNDPADDDNEKHGTEVSRVALAGINDGYNNAGFCPECHVVPMKVLGADGVGTDADIAEAILDAANLGVDIINMSLGSAEFSSLIEAAVAAADAQGVLMIAAAGNDGNTTVNYPAGHPEVIGVAGVELPDGGAGGPYPMAGDEPKYGFSNYGSWVTVSAPGCNVTYQSSPNDGFLFCGTSSATPTVAGTAGLVMADRPALSAVQVRNVLELSALDVVPDEDGTPVAEHGRMSPPRALRTCPARPFDDVAPTHPFCVDIQWMADSGITTGCGNNNYCPNTDVTRGQMSVFMAKFAEADTPNCTTAPFDDVPVDHLFCPHIQWMADNGITAGCGNNNYCPNTDVTRGQMAVFMARLADLL